MAGGISVPPFRLQSPHARHGPPQRTIPLAGYYPPCNQLAPLAGLISPVRTLPFNPAVFQFIPVKGIQGNSGDKCVLGVYVLLVWAEPRPFFVPSESFSFFFFYTVFFFFRTNFRKGDQGELAPVGGAIPRRTWGGKPG